MWVARRVPDGYVSAHANQARITTFPRDDPENCLFATDVVEFARSQVAHNNAMENFFLFGISVLLANAMDIPDDDISLATYLYLGFR